MEITNHREKESDDRKLECPVTQVGKVLELQAAAVHFLETQQTCVYLSPFELYPTDILTWLFEFPRFYQLHIFVLFCYEAEIFFV